MRLRMPFRAVVALFAACLVACGGSEARKPDVVVILIDTLRPDHLPMYGYEHATTPYLAELAQRGVVLEHAYSASTWTAPATASLFTGLYPNQHGITEGFFAQATRASRDPKDSSEDKPKSPPTPREPKLSPTGEPLVRGANADGDRWQGQLSSTVSISRLPDAVATLPELFARAGYSTFGASTNVNITSRMGFDRGFTHFADFTGPEHGKGAAAEVVLEEVRRWKAQRSSDAPYFMYLHFNDSHAPHRPREPVYEPGSAPFAVERAAYDAELRYLDGVLRQLGAELGWDERTLICLVSDHGEEFGEHGGQGHGFSIYSELMRIALVFSWPAELPGARRITTPVSIIDVAPTLAHLAGLETPRHFAGVSLASALVSATPPPERTLFALRFRQGGAQQLWAAQRGPWKLIVSADGPELYDHSKDRFEQENLVDAHPDIVEALSRELDAFRALQPSSIGAKLEVELDAKALDTLRQLGYTDTK
jgi:arylsulfatase A-like enzyme